MWSQQDSLAAPPDDDDAKSANVASDTSHHPAAPSIADSGFLPQVSEPYCWFDISFYSLHLSGSALNDARFIWTDTHMCPQESWADDEPGAVISSHHDVTPDTATSSAKSTANTDTYAQVS